MMPYLIIQPILSRIMSFPTYNLTLAPFSLRVKATVSEPQVLPPVGSHSLLLSLSAHQPLQPPRHPPTHKAYSGLRAFALADPSAWKAFPSPIHMVYSLII